MNSIPARSAGPVVVDVKGVSKRFVIYKDNSLKERLTTIGRRGRRYREDFWALRDVSMEIRAGSTIGLIGHNGSGKSTLLKVIGGILDSTDGSVMSRGRTAALLELGAGFHPDLTGRENVYLNASILGLSREETDAEFQNIVDFAEIGDFIESQVKFYSSGMYVRLAFAVAVHTDPDILLVDEVLSVGDEAFQRKCIDKIRTFQQEGRTIVLVTHNLAQVVDMCDRAILLNQGRVIIDGAPRDAVSVFRDILEGRRAKTNFDAVASSTERGEVTRVEISPVGGKAGIALRPGGNLQVDIDVDFEGTIPDWDLGVQIESGAGSAVYYTTSSASGSTLSPLSGKRSVRLTIEDIWLGAGSYLVSVFIMDGTGRHVIDAMHVSSLEVESDGEATGLISAKSVFVDLA